MSYAKFDFHLHTVWSYDGRAEAEDYFRLARERGLAAIAVTEHNNIDSRAEAKAIALRYPEITYVPGVEFTVHTPFGNMDMLTLGVPEAIPAPLQKVFDRYHRWERDYAAAWGNVLSQAGMDYSETVRKEFLRLYRPEKALALQGITHAQGRLERNWFIEVKKWFPGEDEAKAFKAAHKSELPEYPEFDEVLPAAREAGLLVAIAHPTKYFLTNDLKRMDALREMLGFAGIECAHDLIPPEITPFYRAYCEKYGLFSTAGSDSHSLPGQLYRVGERHDFARHLGEETWMLEILERLGRR